MLPGRFGSMTTATADAHNPTRHVEEAAWLTERAALAVQRVGAHTASRAFMTNHRAMCGRRRMHCKTPWASSLAAFQSTGSFLPHWRWRSSTSCCARCATLPTAHAPSAPAGGLYAKQSPLSPFGAMHLLPSVDTPS